MDLPEPRWGHTSSAYGSNIIIFGGTGSKLFNDLILYDTARNVWSRPEVRGAAPSPRLGHSTTTLPDGKLLVFGGRTDSKHYSDIHIFDLPRLAWVKTVQSPKSYPESRSGHTAILTPDGTKLIVFGGTSAHYKYFANTFILDLATLTWTKQETRGEAPPKRGGHCSFLFNNNMWLFGGFDGKKYYNDLYCLSLDTFSWRKVEAAGALPKPRSGHTATLTNNGTYLLVFGGCGANSEFLSDVHILRLSDMHWDQPKCLGMEPPARFRHTCTEVNNLLYVFSGTGSGTLLADMMALELDSRPLTPPSSYALSIPLTSQPTPSHATSTPPHTTYASPSSHPTVTYTATTTHPVTTYTPPTMHPPVQHLHPPTTHPPPSAYTPYVPPDTEKPSNAEDITELRKLYFAAMVSLKAERQQREDYESAATKMEREVTELRHLLAVEKSVRVAAEERLHEEHRTVAKLEQTTNTKIEKVTKKKQKALLTVQESLTQEQLKNQVFKKQVEEMTEALTQERKMTKELKQTMANVELRSKEGVHALTKELEEMRISAAHMQGQELDTLSLDSLIDLEAKHIQAYQHIFGVRSQKQVELANSRASLLAQLTEDNQRLEGGKVELESKLQSAVTSLSKCKEELTVQQTENATLKAKASRLEGAQMDGLSLLQLVELENMHHEGLRRVSQRRQEHMQNELEVLRKEKDALQEKQMCIICTERPCNCVLLPCRHSSMCTNCCDILTRCPICRADITKRIHVFDK